MSEREALFELRPQRATDAPLAPSGWAGGREADARHKTLNTEHLYA